MVDKKTKKPVAKKANAKKANVKKSVEKKPSLEEMRKEFAKEPINTDKIYISRSNKQVETETKWGKFNVLSSDYIGKMFMKGVHYEAAYIEMILSHMRPGDIVMDVGANFGIHSIPYGKKVCFNEDGTQNESGMVWSFEPQGIVFNLLKDNVKLNLQDAYDNGQIRLYHAAAGHKETKARMNGRCDKGRVIDYHRSQETNYGGLNLGDGGEEVEMVQIDKLMDEDPALQSRRVKFIKIDVEGAERLVIYGARRLIERDRPYIFYEDNWKKVTPQMVKMFNLSKNITNFDISDFLLKEMGYKKIDKIGTWNYLAHPE